MSAELMRRLRELAGLAPMREREGSERMWAELDAFDLFEMLEAAARIGADVERAACVEVADDVGRGSMSGVAAQISNLIRSRSGQ